MSITHKFIIFRNLTKINLLDLLFKKNTDEQELEIVENSIVEHVNIVNAPNQDNSEGV